MTTAIKRSIFALVLSFLFSSFAPLSPAEAVNKPGAKCSKVNSKTKIGGDSYVCTKNPTVKNAQLTWVWVGCLDSNKLYLDANSRLKSITASAAQALKLLDEEIALLKSAAPASEAKAKTFDQQAAEAKLKQANAIAKAKSATENANKVGASTAAGKQYIEAAATWNKVAKSYESAVKNFQRAAASLRDKSTQIAKKEKQKLTVSQNVTNSKEEVKSTLENRKNACLPGL